MAKEKRNAYPLIPIKHWSALRNKFKQSIPGVVTDNYLATVLNISKLSARTNIMPTLKQADIIDDSGKPLELARKWRDDQEYPKVCESIKKKIYPQELLDAIQDPNTDRSGAVRWFANHTGAGTVAVNKMVAFYSLLCEADPAKFSKVKTDTKSKPPKKVKVKKQTESITKPEKKEKNIDGSQKQYGPDININLQVHISADSSPEQIDQIFKSMASHIYNK